MIALLTVEYGHSKPSLNEEGMGTMQAIVDVRRPASVAALMQRARTLDSHNLMDLLKGHEDQVTGYEQKYGTLVPTHMKKGDLVSVAYKRHYDRRTRTYRHLKVTVEPFSVPRVE